MNLRRGDFTRLSSRLTGLECIPVNGEAVTAFNFSAAEPGGKEFRARQAGCLSWPILFFGGGYIKHRGCGIGKKGETGDERSSHCGQSVVLAGQGKRGRGYWKKPWRGAGVGNVLYYSRRFGESLRFVLKRMRGFRLEPAAQGDNLGKAFYAAIGGEKGRIGLRPLTWGNWIPFLFFTEEKAGIEGNGRRENPPPFTEKDFCMQTGGFGNAARVYEAGLGGNLWERQRFAV